VRVCLCLDPPSQQRTEKKKEKKGIGNSSCPFLLLGYPLHGALLGSRFHKFASGFGQEEAVSWKINWAKTDRE
jgi:hypothetical protein